MLFFCSNSTIQNRIFLQSQIAGNGLFRCFQRIFFSKNRTSTVCENRNKEIYCYFLFSLFMIHHYLAGLTLSTTGSPSKNIGCCKYCGRLFKQTKSNNADYCYKHRGYRKIGLRFGKCIDCGEEFSVVATNQKKYVVIIVRRNFK